MPDYICDNPGLPLNADYYNTIPGRLKKRSPKFSLKVGTKEGFNWHRECWELVALPEAEPG